MYSRVTDLSLQTSPVPRRLSIAAPLPSREAHVTHMPITHTSPETTPNHYRRRIHFHPSLSNSTTSLTSVGSCESSDSGMSSVDLVKLSHTNLAAQREGIARSHSMFSVTSGSSTESATQAWVCVSVCVGSCKVEWLAECVGVCVDRLADVSNWQLYVPAVLLSGGIECYTTAYNIIYLTHTPFTQYQDSPGLLLHSLSVLHAHLQPPQSTLSCHLPPHLSHVHQCPRGAGCPHWWAQEGTGWEGQTNSCECPCMKCYWIRSKVCCTIQYTYIKNAECRPSVKAISKNTAKNTIRVEIFEGGLISCFSWSTTVNENTQRSLLFEPLKIIK